jgi:L-asparaginase
MDRDLPPNRVVILGTGGTISGLAADPADNVGYVAGKLDVDELLGSIPAARRQGLVISAEQLCQVDSKDMSFGIWLQLARRVAFWLAAPDVCGVVVTHGTDTLEETAYFLHLVLGAQKPVVLTCAMRPGSALLRDGPQNLSDAIALASGEQGRGVLLVCAGVVHAAADVQKVHTYRLDPFSSGDMGPLGRMEEGRLRCIRPCPDGAAPRVDLSALPDAAHWPRVEILFNQVQADGWVARLLAQAGVKGIVVAGTGNGTISELLASALTECEDAGIRILRATRCAAGPLIGTPHDRFRAASGLSPVKARVALTLELMLEASRPGPAGPGR